MVLLEGIWTEHTAFPEAISVGQLPQPKSLIITLKSAPSGLVTGIWFAIKNRNCINLMFLRTGALGLTFLHSLLILHPQLQLFRNGPTSWRWAKRGLSGCREWYYHFNLITVVFNGPDVVKVILSVILPGSLWSVQLVLRILIVSWFLLSY